MVNKNLQKKRGRVLIAEDQDQMRNVLSRALILEGFEVVATSNGARALDIILGPDSFDLVLLDVNMPEMDGFSVLERIRQTPDMGSLPVIMVTGHVDSVSVMRGVELKVSDYLVKPYKLVDLISRIDRCVPPR